MKRRGIRVSLNIQKIQNLHKKLQRYDKGFTRTLPEFIQDIQDETTRHTLFNKLRKYDSNLTWSYYEFYHELGII